MGSTECPGADYRIVGGASSRIQVDLRLLLLGIRRGVLDLDQRVLARNYSLLVTVGLSFPSVAQSRVADATLRAGCVRAHTIVGTVTRGERQFGWLA